MSMEDLRMPFKRKHLFIASSVLSLLLVATCTSGCTTKEESDTLGALQSALSSLVQNRTLAEQFVRDVKTSMDPTDPSYQQAMETYEEARDSYNRFLDTVESGTKTRNSHLREAQIEVNAQDSTAQFFQDATRALRPSINARAIDFRRAVVIPDHLQKNLRKLPKGARQSLVEQFDGQVRWRAWGQM